jgi:hypothetical protein
LVNNTSFEQKIKIAYEEVCSGVNKAIGNGYFFYLSVEIEHN